MRAIRTFFSSIVFLASASIVLAGATFVALNLAVEYITKTSLSTTDNFYIVGALMFSLALASLFESLLIISVVWGRRETDTKQRKRDDEQLITAMRFMKATGTKKAFVFGVVLAVNIFAYDQLGQGVLVENSRRYHVLTQLRSPEGQVRADAVQSAVQLIGDQAIADALGRILEQPGEAREWAAFAAGKRLDYCLKDALANMLRTGNARERSAAAVALARMKDGRLMRLAADALPHMDSLKKDILIALGMMGKRANITSDKDIEELGGILTSMLKKSNDDKELFRLIIWTAGRIEAREMLPFLEGLLKPETDTATVCMALQALGNIGSAYSSPKMLDLIGKADKKAVCPELTASDFTSHQVLVSSRLNLIARILREIAKIGDREARLPLERLAEDKTQSEEVRHMAAEIAFQLRYAPRPQ